MSIITDLLGESIADGLSISMTNVLINQIPVISSDPGIGETPSNISDPDHSLNYTCGTSGNDFIISYGAQVNLNYIAISGHNAATPAQATIEIYNGSNFVQRAVLNRNNNVMFTFITQNFSDLIIKFLTVPKNHQTTVSYIAAGQYINIPTGEQAGYKRLWLMRHLQQRTTTNMQNMPISSLKKPKGLKGSLSLPNQLKGFTEVDYQNLIDFTLEQPFFIKEQSNKPESSYICFDAKHDISAHPQTRKLNAVKLSFNAFNGL